MTRVLVFGAHPDDCPFFAGGTAALWAAAGHAVRFVSLTNGDLGHWKTVGPTLAARRREETLRAAEILGVESRILETHDGELVPDLEHRKIVVREIREWKADVVLCHRPNDYHPDHRATGTLVQDAAYMVTIPHYCPETPHLPRNPLFLYMQDEFTQPTPFRADVAVRIDEIIERKLDFIDVTESQMFEGGCEANAETVPADPAGQDARRKKVREDFRKHFAAPAGRYRKDLARWYGAERAKAIRFAEVFEVCEYGRAWSSLSAASRAIDEAEIRKHFPFLPGREDGI